MARYFFHTADGVDCYDPDGTELADSDTAWKQAVQLLGVLVNDDPMIVADNHDFTVSVADELGCVLFAVSVHSTRMPGKAFP